MSSEKRERIAYLDTAKAYLILLVIAGHVLITMNPGYNRILLSAAQEFFYTFHMPGFFLLHGALFSTDKWREKPFLAYLSTRARTLLLPYLGFECIGMACRFVFYQQPWMTGLLNLLTVRCNVGADWFLPALFLGTVLTFLDGKYLRQTKASVCVSAVVVIAFVMLAPKNQLVIVLGRGLMAYLFITLGRSGREFFLSGKTKSLPCLSISFVVTLLSAVINLKFGGNDFYTCQIRNPVTFLLGGIAGTILILGLAARLSCRVTETVGRHTLAIMGTHQLIIYAGTALIPGLTGGNIFQGTALFVTIVLAELLLVYGLER